VETERPVPLNTSIWVPGFGFRDMKFLRKLESETMQERKKGRGQKVDFAPLVHHLRREDLMPCIFFHFSRLGCQNLALRFKGLNLLTPPERHQALSLYDESCERFGVTERANAIQMRGLVKNGVAYHHAGVLPAIKDILERLYTLGLIKLLFTTETFAVGMNLPAKSVVFENVMKHDGISFRYLTAREFQQMAGRAGRRGIDEVGYAISCINPIDLSVEGLKGTFARQVEDIESQFSLSYSSLLNLYDRFGEKIYDVCERSFNNYKNVYQVDLLREHMRQVGEDVERLRQYDCVQGDFSQMERFLELRKEFFKYTDKFNKSRHGKKKRGSFELREKIEGVKNSLNDIACQQCKRKKSCIATMKKIKSYEREMELMGDEAVEVENTQRAGIRLRLDLLQNLDYLNEQGLLPRGKIASQIFGYELQFTELYFEGMFEELDEEGLCLLVSCIIFESRRGMPRRRIREKNLQWVIDQGDVTVRHLRKLEQQAGLPNRVDPLDTGMADTVIAWCRGANFEDLRAANLDDGDLVRNFRLIVDFMRQMKRAINEPMFRDKVDRCVKLIYRDVVDAEAQLQTQV
jgi:superfamily II RNA helicase